MSITITGADIPKPDVGGGARILPQGTRYRWEEQWLDRNRDAARTIAAAADESARPAGAGPHPPAPRCAQPDRPAPAARAPLERAPDPSAAAARPAQPMAAAPAVLALYRNTAPAIAPPPVFATTALPPAGDAAPAESASGYAAGARAPQTAPKRFGLWLDEDAVTLSLRSEGADPAPALHHLRRWLRGMGLTLRAVIVNGAEYWRQAPRPAAQPVSDTRQEITPWP